MRPHTIHTPHIYLFAHRPTPLLTHTLPPKPLLTWPTHTSHPPQTAHRPSSHFSRTPVHTFHTHVLTHSLLLSSPLTHLSHTPSSRTPTILPFPHPLISSPPSPLHSLRAPPIPCRLFFFRIAGPNFLCERREAMRGPRTAADLVEEAASLLSISHTHAHMHAHTQTHTRPHTTPQTH